MCYNRLASGAVNTLDLENLNMYRSDLSTFEVERVNLNALLFQCGYLTLVDEEDRPEGIFYTLDYPNHEVRLSLNRQLLEAVTGDVVRVSEYGRALLALLDGNDFAGFERELQAFFAGIPYQWGAREAGEYGEGYYASLLYSCFVILGMDIRVEDSTSRGRSDMVLARGGQVFVLELKVAREAQVQSRLEEALVQMRDKDYAGKYRTGSKTVHLLALVFDRDKRNLAMMRAGG